MQPRRYTELFFLDEATALAAGHRPCFECRRVAALDFAARWNICRGETSRVRADHMDRILHAERLDQNGAKRTYRTSIDTLPDCAFFHHSEGVARATGRYIQVWSLGGYGKHLPRPKGIEVEVLTPRSTVAVLGAGYMPVLHTSAIS